MALTTLILIFLGLLVENSLSRVIPTTVEPSNQIRPGPVPWYTKDKAIAMPRENQRLPGDNSAYYSGSIPPERQLFKVEELDIAPNPPVV